MEHNKDRILRTIESIDFEHIQKHPNILIAARFWDDDRYRAATTCYKFMRKIDDLIDDRKSIGVNISECEKNLFTEQVNEWVQCIRDKKLMDEEYGEIVDVIHRFDIPLSIFQSFANAMLFDIENDGFKTYTDFVTYAQGASVAPASVFVHLCCLNDDFSGYAKEGIDPVFLARPCAMFSYLVHIIRDFEVDQKNHLNYFAADIMEQHGINRATLKHIASTGVPNAAFRKLIRFYYNEALRYKIETEKVMEYIMPSLSIGSKLSLEVIFDLYKMVFERIDPERGVFTKERLNPEPGEFQTRVQSILSGYAICE